MRRCGDVVLNDRCDLPRYLGKSGNTDRCLECWMWLYVDQYVSCKLKDLEVMCVFVCVFLKFKIMLLRWDDVVGWS